MNGFDILVLIIVGISALLAFARGFVRELLSMAALVIGVLAAVWGLPAFREAVRSMLQPNWVADTATVVGIFLLVYIAVRVLTGRIHEWVHDSEPLGILDRSAGILFGVARGFVIAAIPVLLLNSVAKKEMRPKFITEAHLYPFLAITAEGIKAFTPSATKSATDLAKNAATAGEEVAKWHDNAQMLQDATNAISSGQAPTFDAPENDVSTQKETSKTEKKPVSKNALKIEKTNDK